MNGSCHLLGIEYVNNAGSADVNCMIFRTTSNAEKLRITSGGQVRIGNENNLAAWGQNNRLQVAGTDWSTSGITIANMSSGNIAPNLVFGKSRGGSPGTAVGNGDRIGYITFAGDDGTDLHTVGAAIVSQVDGSPSSNSIPSSLIFYTGGNQTANDHLHITSHGRVGINQSSPAAYCIHASHNGDGSNQRVDLHMTNATTGHNSNDGVQFGYQNTYGAYIWNYENTPIYFGVNNLEQIRINSTGQTWFKSTVGIQTNDVTRANLANPVGAGHSLVGMYIGDGSLLFNNTLNRTGGYYISTETNALNAGPVTLDANMKIDGAWVIV